MRRWTIVSLVGLIGLVVVPIAGADEPEAPEGWTMPPDAAIVRMTTVEGSVVRVEAVAPPELAERLAASPGVVEDVALKTAEALPGQAPALCLLKDPEHLMAEYAGKRVQVTGEPFNEAGLQGIIARSVKLVVVEPDGQGAQRQAPGVFYRRRALTRYAADAPEGAFAAHPGGGTTWSLG